MHHSSAWVGAINVALSMIHVSVSVANSFVHSSTAADQGNHAFGELMQFFYTACCRRLRKRHHCLSSNNGKSIWSQIILGSQQSMTKTSSLVRVWWLRWAKSVAIICKKISSWCPSVSRRFRQLCPVNRCCTLRHWTGFKLLPSCNCGWWGRCCSFTTLQQTLGWAAGEGLDQGERGWGVPGWVPVLCAGTAAAGAVVHEEPP